MVSQWNILKSKQNHHQRTFSSTDFYSLSNLRYLLFHVQEYRFAIPQIQGHLTKSGLKFCGFELINVVQQLKSQNTDEDALYDVEAWNAFEHDNQNMFTGCYQFWCQKSD
jgi:hypothetical protein